MLKSRLIAVLMLCTALPACHRDEPAPANAAAAPDPDAPPPGSQAAEAIGADTANVTRP